MDTSILKCPKCSKVMSFTSEQDQDGQWILHGTCTNTECEGYEGTFIDVSEDIEEIKKAIKEAE